jgi:LPS-assembly lipoprotein
MNTRSTAPVRALDARGAAGAGGGDGVRASRRQLLAWTGRGGGGVVVAVALSACGFRLRSAPELAFSSLACAVTEGTPLALALRRTLQGWGGLMVLPAGAPHAAAEVVLETVSDRLDRVVVGLNAAGQVRELELRMTWVFRLRTPAGKMLIDTTELQQRASMSYSESQALAKEAEEAFLVRDMRADLIAQIQRRLAAVRSL